MKPISFAQSIENHIKSQQKMTKKQLLEKYHTKGLIKEKSIATIPISMVDTIQGYTTTQTSLNNCDDPYSISFTFDGCYYEKGMLSTLVNKTIVYSNMMNYSMVVNGKDERLQVDILNTSVCDMSAGKLGNISTMNYECEKTSPHVYTNSYYTPPVHIVDGYLIEQRYWNSINCTSSKPYQIITHKLGVCRVLPNATDTFAIFLLTSDGKKLMANLYRESTCSTFMGTVGVFLDFHCSLNVDPESNAPYLVEFKYSKTMPQKPLSPLGFSLVTSYLPSQCTGAPFQVEYIMNGCYSGKHLNHSLNIYCSPEEGLIVALGNSSRCQAVTDVEHVFLEQSYPNEHCVSSMSVYSTQSCQVHTFAPTMSPTQVNRTLAPVTSVPTATPSFLSVVKLAVQTLIKGLPCELFTPKLQTAFKSTVVNVCGNKITTNNVVITNYTCFNGTMTVKYVITNELAGNLQFDIVKNIKNTSTNGQFASKFVANAKSLGAPPLPPLKISSSVIDNLSPTVHPTPLPSASPTTKPTAVPTPKSDKFTPSALVIGLVVGLTLGCVLISCLLYYFLVVRKRSSSPKVYVATDVKEPISA